jgi:precorrin-8X/cobalt-precorrin-8 methylmutase
VSLDPITTESFLQIDAELAALGLALSPDRYPCVRRVIHSTADFTYAETLHFHPRAIAAGLDALHAQAPLIADVQMVAVGIDQRRVQVLGGRTVCLVHDPATRQDAATTGSTRSAAAMRRAATAAGTGAIAVIGNAPTALCELLGLIDAGAIQPALIIGVPVGFVDAAESKAALMARTDIPWISVAGRKGGSPVAVALINALLHMAVPPTDPRLRTTTYA